MGLKNAKDGKLLYHLTAIENLSSIIDNGLLSRNEIQKKNIPFIDIANPNIIEKRALTQLNDYIPFHFHPYSAFDLAVKSKYKDINFIYLCIKREFAQRQNFYILPRHPLSEKDFTLLSYNDGFNTINWDIMCKTDQELNHKEINLHDSRMIKMAECIVPKVLKFNNICNIYVKNNKIRNIILHLFHQKKINKYPYININKDWFNIRGE